MFKWFGSKWQSGRKYPAPAHGKIIEPFAGGAGYSLNYCERDVTICETDPHLSKLWPWLIGIATEAMIREIPINTPEGTDIRALGLSDGQALLLKTWQRTNNVGDCWTISPWGNKPGQWTESTRSRVADEVGATKHWKFLPDAMPLLHYAANDWYGAADHDNDYTWFIDPMYQYNYQYRNKTGHDYEKLGKLIKSLPGQVIVCEAVCPKTGAIPNWLPFRHFAETVTSRRKVENNHHSKELIWTNQ